MLQQHSPDTPQVKGSCLYYFIFSMMTVPGGKDQLKVYKKPVIFQTTLDKHECIHETCMYSQVHEAPPAQQKQTGKGIVRVLWFFMTWR